MLGYSRSVNLKTPQKFGEDSMQNTACDTNFFNDSATQRTNFFGQSSSFNKQSNSKLKASVAFSRAKTMVDTLLEEINDKNAMNNQVLQDIYDVNIEAAQEVAAWPNYQMVQKKPITKKSKTRNPSKKVSIKQKRVDTFESQPNEDGNYSVQAFGSGWNSKSVYEGLDNINCGDRSQRPTTRVYETDNIQQIQHLQQIISQQCQNNSSLLQKCQNLQNQNIRLKQSIHYQNNNTYKQLLSEFENLKRQNEILRQDTVRLLKKVR